MKKVIFWGNEKEYNKYNELFKQYQEKEQFTIIGIVLSEPYDCDYPTIQMDEIPFVNFDIFMTDNKIWYLQHKEELYGLGIKEEQVIFAYVITTPEFILDDYIKLKQSNVSIIGSNCWGGITYKTLGLKTLSPIINMFIKDEDFFTMLLDFDTCLEAPLKFEFSAFNKEERIEYPVYSINGIKLYMIHYADFDEACRKWEERKERINKDNLFIMMQTSSESILKKFDELGYSKKVCFTSFPTDSPSAIYLPYKDLYDKGETVWNIANYHAMGQLYYYNPIKLLNGELGKRYKNM